jgi:hypothetical protein
MATTSTERMQQLVERRRLGITLPSCKICGAKCTSPASKKSHICYVCWRDSPEGRKQAIANAKRAWQRKKLLKQAGLTQVASQPIEWASAKETPSNGEQVLVETLRGALTLATFDHDQTEWIDAVDNFVIVVKHWARIEANLEAHTHGYG